MSKIDKSGLDRAVEYTTKLEKFRALFESQDAGCAQSRTLKHSTVEHVEIEKGRKFDKVYVNTGVQRLARYMVDRNSWAIFGVKSWAQINPRRQYGTIDTIEQYNWANYSGTPKSGTDAEKEFTVREAEITKNYKPRGRPRKTVVTP